MKEYRKPGLRHLGRIADMTLNQGGAGPDGNNDNANNLGQPPGSA